MTAHTNRLAAETSPYLLQHAHNPVDWYAWGPEALARAKAEDRPILLSVGYSACHWCHVMERESFEDEATARLMNEHYVSIKVDREERPDLDQIYQTAVQILGGHGGWPLTMFLTPDLEPFFGGTYYPPARRHGMPAFSEVLRGVADAYKSRRTQVASSADQLTAALREIEGGEASPGEITRELVESAAESLTARFEPDYGGFGKRPKFPNTHLLELWLRRGQPFTERVAYTLEKMASGGIYDQLGGGWHRYSTDDRWLVPHFEKMLYDNALLLRLSAQVFQATGNPLFSRVARETGEYVLREMTDPKGGFFSTQDADSEGEEGRFFAWDEAEVESLVGSQDAELVTRVFGFAPGGNFEHGRTVLHRPIPLEGAAKLVGIDPAAAPAIVERARRIMLEAREKRVHPALDDKVLAGWNGLMIHALAVSGSVLKIPAFVDAAARCSDFLHREMFDADAGLLRTWRGGKAKIPAFSEDYAFLAEGELALFEATGRAVHFERARRLATDALRLFFDGAHGGFFVTREGGEALIQRPKAQYDNAVPSATSSLTHALLRLEALTGDAAFGTAAEVTLRGFGDAIRRNTFGHAYLACAADASVRGLSTLVVTGPEGDPAREALLAAARARFEPNLVVVPWSGAESLPSALGGLLEGKHATAAAWLCRRGACSLPETTPDGLARLLDARPATGLA